MGMALGKYYSQSKQNLLLRQREKPEVEFLDEDYQALVSTPNTTIPQKSLLYYHFT